MLASASPRRLALLEQIGYAPDTVEPAALDETVLPGEQPEAHAARLAPPEAEAGPAPGGGEPAARDEPVPPGEQPEAHAARLAHEKAAAVAARHPGAFVLGADTVVACGRRILDKAETEESARRCLSLLSGRRHRVFGGVAVIDPTGRAVSRLVRTAVTFKRLSAEELEDYLAAGEWRGEGGGHGGPGGGGGRLSLSGGGRSPPPGGEWRGKAGGYAIQGRAAAFVRFVGGSYSNVVGLPLHETYGLLAGLGLPPRPPGPM